MKDKGWRRKMQKITLRNLQGEAGADQIIGEGVISVILGEEMKAEEAEIHVTIITIIIERGIRTETIEEKEIITIGEEVVAGVVEIGGVMKGMIGEAMIEDQAVVVIGERMIHTGKVKVVDHAMIIISNKLREVEVEVEEDNTGSVCCP